MANKSKTKSKVSAGAAKKPVLPTRKSITESAQQIWLAGLGAFAKTQEQGSKVFESLINEGARLEAKTRQIATGKVDEVRGVVESGVSQVRERTQETWDRLEQVFENRVSRALGRLGVPERKELDALLARIETLDSQVRKFNPVARKNTIANAVKKTARRARDDFGDLLKDVEDAQLATKKTVLRAVDNASAAAKSVTKAVKKSAKKNARKVAKKIK